MVNRLCALQVLEAMSDIDTDGESVDSIYNESVSDDSNIDDIDASASDSDANSESSSCHDDWEASDDNSTGYETPTSSSARSDEVEAVYREEGEVSGDNTL